MAITIQNLVRPDQDLSNCTELYYRVHDTSTNLSVNSCITIQKGGEVQFDTFFNAFSISPWLSTTAVRKIKFVSKIIGDVEVSICHLKMNGSVTILQRETPSNDSWHSSEIDLSQLKNGLLFFKIRATSETRVEDIQVTTDQPIRSVVRLGLVITTFNRQKQTLAAITRISRSIQDLEESERGQYKIFVIDNGRNLPKDLPPICEVIPNANLGGTGGFMRGLIELKERGIFTHCLFMDDDASCFFESIARTKRLFEYATTPKLAISGSMLLDNPSYMQHEFTAYVNRVCIPRLSKLDIRKTKNLLRNDDAATYLSRASSLPTKREADSTSYGGWWFFAFSISDVSTYSFPFFVRGDDVFFSIHNKFVILAINGVASWQESFATKNTPFITYLGSRCDFVQLALLPNKSMLSKMMEIPWQIHRLIFKNIFSYRYAHAKAAILAIRDFLKGPDFWFENLDFEPYLKSVSKSLSPSIRNFEVTQVEEIGDVPKQNILMRLARLIFLNGHLLPFFATKSDTIFFKEGSSPPASTLFGRSSYAIRTNTIGNEFYYFHRSLKDFLILSLVGVGLMLKLLIKFPYAYKKYHKSLDTLLSTERWKKTFKSFGS